jgi:hypothetical protein
MKRFAAVVAFTCFALASIGQSKKTRNIESIVKKWASLNNAHDIHQLEKLYAPIVNFYGKSKDISTCLNDKKVFFQRFPDYSILIDNLSVDFYENGAIRCNFTKTEKWDGDIKTDNAYLVFEKRNGRYFITTEGDERMDTKTGVTTNLGDKTQQKSGGLTLASGGLIVLLVATAALLVRRARKRRKQPASASQPFPTNSSTTFDLNAEKGSEFERYVVELFDKKNFRLINWRSDKKAGAHYPLSNMDPDLEIEYRDSYNKIRFALECKWRQSFFNNRIEWAKDYQLRNYKNYESSKNQTVFIIIGVGGTPNQPKEVFIVPLRSITACILYKSDLEQYRRYKKTGFFLHTSSMKLE